MSGFNVWHFFCSILPEYILNKEYKQKNIIIMQKGNIGVTTENIFPIIKKFLYSDHEIFLRVQSTGCSAQAP